MNPEIAKQSPDALLLFIIELVPAVEILSQRRHDG